MAPHKLYTNRVFLARSKYVMVSLVLRVIWSNLDDVAVLSMVRNNIRCSDRQNLSQLLQIHSIENFLEAVTVDMFIFFLLMYWEELLISREYLLSLIIVNILDR